MTKIAIPSMSDSGLESYVCFHYGSCEYFTIVDLNNKDIEIVKIIRNLSPKAEHNCATPSIIMKSHKVDTVLVAGIGGRPLISLAEKNIKVFAGTMSKVSNIVEDYNNGSLRELSMKGTCNCSHH